MRSARAHAPTEVGVVCTNFVYSHAAKIQLRIGNKTIRYVVEIVIAAGLCIFSFFLVNP